MPKKQRKAEIFKGMIQTGQQTGFFFLSVVIAFSVEAPLTLAGHACWLIAGLAHAVVDGGAAGLGGVLRIRARQAGSRASWSSLGFIGARRTSCGGQRRYRFHDQEKKKRKEKKTWIADMLQKVFKP